jgi:hypothetical protein
LTIVERNTTTNVVSEKLKKTTMPHTNEIRSLFDLAGLSAPVIMITNLCFRL